MKKWELKVNSYPIADTGDYDVNFEITNGDISIYTNDDDDEALNKIVDALNESECSFYIDDFGFENHLLHKHIEELELQINTKER